MKDAMCKGTLVPARYEDIQGVHIQ